MPRFARPTSLARLMAGGVFATIVGLVAAWLPVAAQRPPGPREVEATPEQLVACLASGTAETARNRSTRVMRFIGTTAGRALPHPLRHNARTPMETAARGYLDVCGSLFGLSGDPGELELARAAIRNGRSVVRFQQKYRGIPVFGGELVVHLDRDRNIIATSGHILPRIRLATTASVTAAQATRTAIDEIAHVYEVPTQELTATAPRLWIYSETLLGPGQGPAQLVWRIDVATRDLRPVRELIRVDAIRGNLVLHFNQVDTALERQTFTANNTLSLRRIREQPALRSESDEFVPNASTGVDNGGCSATLSTLTDSNDWTNITFLGISDSDGLSLFRPTVDCNNPLMPRVVPEEWRRP